MWVSESLSVLFVFSYMRLLSVSVYACVGLCVCVSVSVGGLFVCEF